MKYKFIVKVGNLAPSYDDGDHFIKERILFWEDIQKKFKKPQPFDTQENGSIAISLNVQDCIKYLEAVLDLTNGKKRKFKSRIKNIYNPRFYSEIQINIHTNITPAQLEYKYYIYRFLEFFYLSASLSSKGAFSSINSTFLYKSPKLPKINHPFAHFIDDELPSLDGGQIESCYNQIEKYGISSKNPPSFDECWNWLLKNNFPFLNTASTPFERSLFTILSLGNTEVYEECILQIARTLESLCVDGKESVTNLLSERICLLLGNNDKKFNSHIKKLYNMRSRIAHGQAIAIRPNIYKSTDPSANEFDEISNYLEWIDFGGAILIRLIQDLIKNKATSFKFDQSYHYE